MRYSDLNPEDRPIFSYIARAKYKPTSIEDFGDDVETEIALIEQLCQHHFGKSLTDTVMLCSEQASQPEKLTALWRLAPSEVRIRDVNSVWNYVLFVYEDHHYLMSDWDGIVWLVRVPMPTPQSPIKAYNPSHETLH